MSADRNLVGWSTGIDASGRVVRIPLAHGCDKCGKLDNARYGVPGGWFCTECWLDSVPQLKSGFNSGAADV